tara:strand:+ start:205 stop:483 length:279 start_codon:yes stop_codon:yes gene_type:complete
MKFKHEKFEDYCKRVDKEVPCDPDRRKHEEDKLVVREKQNQLNKAWDAGAYGFEELLQEAQLYNHYSWQTPRTNSFRKRVEYVVQQLVDIGT